MLDEPIIMGVNAPKEHQKIIRKLAMALGLLYDTGQILYEPYPETMVDASKSSPTPDILLFDNESEKNIALIEVTIPASEDNDFEKTAILVEKYKMAEGFIYNYRKNNWRKYKLGEGEITENPSFCDSIGYDLNEFLK